LWSVLAVSFKEFSTGFCALARSLDGDDIGTEARIDISMVGDFNEFTISCNFRPRLAILVVRAFMADCSSVISLACLCNIHCKHIYGLSNLT